MNSWDVFDTLLARKFIKPKTVFDEVARRIGDNSFKEKRVEAEKKTKGTEGDYWDIYKHLPEYDPQVELDVEIEHNYPIMENLMRVQDGDLILSDMYLPPDFIMSMLRNCGLEADVDIIVTRYGKKNGYIWDRIKQEYHDLENHYGDNAHSDVKSAQDNGVNGVLVEQHRLTKQESIVYEEDKHLAALMRFVRLMCPYEDEPDLGDGLGNIVPGRKYKTIWNDQANINIPGLVTASLLLPADKTIAFSYRDCRNWQVLYEALTGKKGIALKVSRKMWLEPTPEFDAYIAEHINKDTAIVDLQGKGKSIWTYFDGKPPQTFYIGGKTMDYINVMTSVHTKIMEKLNCLDQASVVSYDANGPVYAEYNDHPEDYARVQMAAVELAATAIPDFNLKPRPHLIQYFASRMQKCATGKLIAWEKYNGLD
jgi:FMN phosphatase YigB (HAD superfamily)